MKAAVIKQAGATPVYEDFPEPPADEGRELVSLVAAGIHPIVRSLASGGHYGSAGGWPLIPGVDAVARTADGRLVYAGFTQHPYGTFAERMSVPMTLPLPDGTDSSAVLQIAAGLNPGMSSWLPLRSMLADGPLGTVLVLGATGVAGGLAVHNARALGAKTVVAVGRNRAALESLDSPMIITVALTGDDDADAAALRTTLTEQRPATVLDFVWGRPAELTFDALSRSGLAEDEHSCSYIEIGAAAGARAAVPAALLRSTSITIRGSGAGSAKVSDIVAELPVFMSTIADGTVRVPVSPCPLEDVSHAWQDQQPGRRVVLTGAAA